MIKNFVIETCKPRLLNLWIEYFIQFSGFGEFDVDIFAQPYAYILFNNGNVLNFSFNEKKFNSQKSLIEPITQKPFTLNTKLISENKVFGAKIKSTFLYIITGIPLNKLTGNIFYIDEIFESNTDNLINQINNSATIDKKAEIAEKFFFKKLQHYEQKKNADSINSIKYLTNNFYSTFNINQLLDKLNVSHRSLDRHFQKYTGVSPKSMLSIIRFSKIIDYALKYKTLDLNTIWNFGYYDYAHFSKDFKRYSGKTFKSYVSSLKYGENLQVKKAKVDLHLPEILIY